MPELDNSAVEAPRRVTDLLESALTPPRLDRRVERRYVDRRNWVGSSVMVGNLATEPLPVQDVNGVPERAIIRVPHPPPRTEQFITLQNWEGTVIGIQNDEFTAITRDLTNPTFPEEQVSLLLEDVPVADRDLVAIGAVFYWTIGYEENEYGTRKRVSQLRFRRLPAWSRGDLERVKRAADELSPFFENG